MNIDELKPVARAIVAEHKGLLAADESGPTIKKRFDSVKLESTEETRRRYREILFTTRGIEQTIGGVILFDETLRQTTADGIPFAELLSRRGIMPGIKVDQGAKERRTDDAAHATDVLTRLDAPLGGVVLAVRTEAKSNYYYYYGPGKQKRASTPAPSPTLAKPAANGANGHAAAKDVDLFGDQPEPTNTPKLS